MGRAKLNMELIQKEKSRVTTFKKRKDGLLRKIHEFTTLCGVDACMIIYGPKSASGGGSDVEPEIWPRDADKVRETIEVYKAKSKDSGNKTSGLPEFFNERKRKIEDELTKLRRKNREAKYPAWMNFMDVLDEHQLQEFAAVLAGKAEAIRARIQFLQSSRSGGNQEWGLGSASTSGLVMGSGLGMGLGLEMGMGLDASRIGQSSLVNFNPPDGRGYEFNLIMNQQAGAMIAYQPTVAAIEHHHQYRHQQQPQQHDFEYQINPDSMTWQFENGNTFIAGPSTTGNVHNSSAGTLHRLQFTYGAAGAAPGTSVVDNQVLAASTFGWFHSAAPVPQAMHMAHQQVLPLPPAMQFAAEEEKNNDDVGVAGSFGYNKNSY